MRRSDRAMTLESCHRFLERASVGRLAMISRDEPYVIPVNFVYQDGAVYFHSAREGRKMEAIQSTPNVCFETDVMLGIKDDTDPCSMGTYYRSVIVFGVAEIVQDNDEALRALEAVVAKHSRRPDREAVSREDMEDVCVVRIIPREITGKVLEAPQALREPV